MQKVLGYLFILQFLTQYVFTQQESYRAAVLEFAPKLTGATPADHIRENTRQYDHNMKQAALQGAQIIVFPEYGLTGWEIPVDQLDQVSTVVPDPVEQIAPCDKHYHQNTGTYSNYSQFFVDLSCAARNNHIYTVVNLLEWRYENNSYKKIYHNTNVAFDRTGIVIARYRKINLFDEPNIVPGGHTDILSTFKTDFGVTFGMFICFDIVFKTPALDILDNFSVNDIVYSTAWYSTLPYYGATSIQHGYAKSNGVNLLAAGLNNPAAAFGGSGIYLANGRIVETYISGAKGSKLIIQDVPKVRTRKNLSNTCQSASDSPNSYQTEDISLFDTKKADLHQDTFKSLNLDSNEISETICGGKNIFCCSFNITVNNPSGNRPNYRYKLAAFNGVSKVSSTKTIGIRNCGLIACLNDNSDSCGGRHREPPTITFDRISIKGIFDNKNSHEQPSTLNFDLKPSTDYMYCTKTSNNKIEINLSTTHPQKSLLTFGILGRVFDNDDKPEGSINSANINIMNVYVVFIVSILIFLLQE